MLDVHIAISRDTKHEWVLQCLGSVRIAADNAGFPVAVHKVDGVPGHIGQARAAGYAEGSQPFATFVDDDDYVQPHAFRQMESALRSGASAVCTPETTLQNGHLMSGLPRHHLIAYRRDTLIDHALWVCCGDLAQTNAIGPDAVDLEIPAYVHRVYLDSKARILRRTHHDELERARG